MAESREEKKLKAYRLAEFRLKQRFDMIDFMEDEIRPELEELRSKLKATVRIEIPSSLGDADSA